MDRLDALLARQSGVVSRRQLIAVGCAPHDVRRLLRRRELVARGTGVYVDHTGDLTWLQQAWCGVLSLWPAALCHESALHVAGVRRVGPSPLLHVAVDRDRSPAAPDGVRLHRLAHLDSKVQWQLGPPRVRVEEAALDVASTAHDDLAAVAVLADAVQSRRTTAARMERALGRRSRIPRRGFLEDVLVDVGQGTCSVLEHGYLTRVERPHGLPTARRQVRESLSGTVYRDVTYDDFGRVVELDGRLGHDRVEDRDRDLDRDLDVAVVGRASVRLGWGQVFRRPCRTAKSIGRWLQAGGWTGRPFRCPECPVDT
jgi:hypothetical protein